MENKQYRKHFSTLGFILLIGSLLLIGVEFGTMKLIGAIPALDQNANLEELTNLITLYFVSFLLLLLMFRILPAEEMAPQKKMPLSHICVTFIMCYSLTYICNLTGIFITGFLGLFSQIQVSEPSADAVDAVAATTQEPHFLLPFLGTVILAPIFEELIFRKALISRTINYGESICVLLSGITFALFHGNSAQTFYSFVLGVFAAFIYVKTKNILYPVILHMVINLFGAIAELLLEKYAMDFATSYLAAFMNGASSDELMALLTEYSGVLIICAVLIFMILAFVITGIVLFFVHLKKYKFSPGKIRLNKKTLFSVVFLNPGMILFMTFWIIWLMLPILFI